MGTFLNLFGVLTLVLVNQSLPMKAIPFRFCCLEWPKNVISKCNVKPAIDLFILLNFFVILFRSEVTLCFTEVIC